MKEKQNDFIAVCVIYLIVFVTLGLLQFASYLGFFSLFEIWQTDVLFTVLSQIGVMFLLPVLAMVWYKKRNRRKVASGMSFSEFVDIQKNKEESVLKSWGFGNPGVKVIAVAFLLGFLMYFLNIYVSAIFNGTLGLLGFRHSSGGKPTYIDLGFTGLLIAMFLGAVLPGICEETTHRGLLLRGFASRVGVMRAVMLSSILFGLLHMNVVQVFYTAILGYIMALAILATRSIWTGIIMHFMNNAIVAYSSYTGGLMTFISNFINSGGFILLIALPIILYICIVQIIHVFARENYIKDHMHEPDGVKIPRNLKGLNAIKFYLSANDKEQKAPLKPIEKTLLYGTIFLGTTITVIMLVWGFLWIF